MMSKLIDNQGREHFKGMSRNQIEEALKKETDRGLASLREVFVNNNKYPLEQIANIKKEQ